MTRPHPDADAPPIDSVEPGHTASFKNQLDGVKSHLKGALSQLLRSQFELIRTNLVEAVRELADEFEKIDPGELIEEDGLALFEEQGSFEGAPPGADEGDLRVFVEDSPHEAPLVTQETPVEDSIVADEKPSDLVEATEQPSEIVPRNELPAEIGLAAARQQSVRSGAMLPLAQGETGLDHDSADDEPGNNHRRATRLATSQPPTLRLKNQRRTELVIDSSRTIISPAGQEATPLPEEEAPRGHHEPASPLAGHLFSEAGEQRRRHENTAALARYQEVIGLDPLFVPAYSERGQLWRSLGQHDKALADFRRACDLDPEHAEAFLRCGNVLVDLGRFDEAISHYTRAIELDPQQPVYYLNRGLAHARQSSYAEVIADADQALALDHELADAYFIRGFAFHRRGRHDEALADFQRLLELNPRNALAWNERGLVHLSMRQYSAAIRNYVQALKINPRLLLARYNRGIAYRLKGDYLMAINDFSEILRRKPRHCQAYLNRGICHFAKGDYDRALPDLAQAHELLPEDKEIAARLKQVRAALKEHHRARARQRALAAPTLPEPVPPLVNPDGLAVDFTAPTPLQPKPKRSVRGLLAAIPFRAMTAAALLVALIYPIYAMTAGQAPRWQRYSVQEICQVGHDMAQDAEIELCGHIRSIASENDPPSLVLGTAEGAEQVACQLDPWALSIKRQLPRARAGQYVILKGKFRIASNGAPTLAGAHFSDKSPNLEPGS
ncbi:MAG: tetratricopeptide repeat protein [Gemmataceae bacterium]